MNELRLTFDTPTTPTRDLEVDDFHIVWSKRQFTVDYGHIVTAWIVEPDSDRARTATAHEVRQAFTIRRADPCWHEHDCCGCLVSRHVLAAVQSVDGSWYLVIETLTNV